MFSRKQINRRLFLKKALHWGRAGLLGLLPGCINRNPVMASREENNIVSTANSLSLREVAEKKMHHGNGRFLNPFSSAERGSFLRVLSWKLFHENHFKSLYKGERVIPFKVDWAPIMAHSGCTVTFLKHASVMIRDLDKVLLVDPIFFELLWIKDFSPFSFDPDKMPSPDHVLITHGHFDHLDKNSLKTLGKKTHVITPLGYDGVFDDLEIKARTQLDWFESYDDGDREIVFLPCNHWTMRNPFVGPNDSLWGSFLIKGASGLTIFVAGDAAYFDRYRELGEMGPIDLAIFNLGAYEPRWFMENSHMNPAETVKAFLELGAKHLLVVHWGSFRLGDEPVHVPPKDIKNEMEKEGLLDHLIVLDHGQTLFYDRSKEMHIA